MPSALDADWRLALQIGGVLLALLHALGLASAVHAALRTRTPQGAIAWCLVLATLPYFSLPLYWIFGRNKYRGYVIARRQDAAAFAGIERRLLERVQPFVAELPAVRPGLGVIERLAHMPFTRANRSRLLIDGEATFAAIRAGIAGARDYLLVQFFIWKDDELGREIRDLLTSRARAGVRVLLVYDEIGSHGLPRGFFAELQRAGGRAHPFGTTRGFFNRFQLNFRNHRKVVVADGLRAWVGGHNVGDEYMGRDARIGPWRDTHVELEGPVVLGVQLAFLEDWYWATHELPEWNWEPRAAAGGDQILVTMPTGPADELESCGLAFVEAIHAARRRIWITSPYFVPDPAVVSALQLAALKGVDVRVLLPAQCDHRAVWLAGFSFYDEVLPWGVALYRYGHGFLHQKVVLIDDAIASVGTANLDNRSFRLNFEISIVHYDSAFAAEVETMLERDFARARRARVEDVAERGLPFRLGVRLARLVSPIL